MALFAVFAAAGGGLVDAAGGAPQPTSFAACESDVRSRPEVYEAYLCFLTTARASGLLAEADRRLAALPGEGAPAGWATLVRGHLWLLGDEPRAIALYRRAADLFAAAGTARGEVIARHNLRNLLHRRGESAEAADQVARALAVGERSGEPAVLAQALVLGGTHRVETGGDLGRAYRDLRRAQQLLPADASYSLHRVTLLALANVSFQLGRYDEAIATYERLLALAKQNADAVEEATTAFNIANARQRQLEEHPTRDGRAQLAALAESALATSRRAGHRLVEVRAAALLAQLDRARGDRAGARARLEEALALARALDHPERMLICLWLLAELAADDDPAEAQRRSAEAAALAVATDNDRLLAYSWQWRMRVDWRTLPRAEATAGSWQALGAIETLAAQQPEEAATVGLFGAWARDYRYLAGRVLDAPAPDLATAFAVMERMRARALLAALSSGREEGAGGAGELGERERVALRELVTVQRELLGGAVPAGDRAALLARLEERELALAAARSRDAGELHPPRPAAPRGVAALAELRSALRPGEAVLVYQLAPWRDLYGDFAGGSWALVVAAGGASVHRLPDRAVVEPLVPVFLGLLARRDGGEAAAAARLWQLLLAAPLATLPAGTERLIVVPDGALFSLPFEVLQPTAAGAEPLGVRYEVAVVPSATALLRWRRSAVPPAARSVLVFADPELPGAPAAAGGGGDATLGEDLALGPLPEARREGRALARLLRPTSELLEGAAASERALARPGLDAFAIVHFAAHAIADGAHPQRSAVLLAAGDAAEDGLLQGREITRLPLGGRTVVLSACRTAAGALAAGEGPLSLARAFQQAGARAVVGSRWALRDDEAAELVGSFYRQLVAGRSLGAALRAARREAWADGRPAAAWAALVLMGEPATEPLAGVPVDRPSWGRRLAWGVPVAMALVLAAAAYRRRRRL